MTRNHPPSFDFYPDDFVAGTMGMHPFARGMYITLLCHQWSHGSVNPANIRQLAQITGALPDEISEHLPEVIGKFEQRGEQEFVNARLDREYRKKIEIREKRQQSGRLGGRPGEANENHLQSKCLTKSKANLEVGSRKKEDLKKENESVVSASPELPFSSPEFAEAWSDFVQMRREIKKPMKPTNAKAALKKLGRIGESRAIAALEHTTANGWQGIREPDQPSKPSGDVKGKKGLDWS